MVLMLCPTCGLKKKALVTKARCGSCYYKWLKSRWMGVCSRCNKERRLRPTTGLCLYCHLEHRRKHAAPVACSQCRTVTAPFCKGLCRPCYTNNVKRQMKYGLNANTYLAMAEEQDGRCAICAEPMKKTPHVDHDHATGVVRSLLCDRCNIGLGSFEDSPERLRAAAKYIEAHRARKVA